MIQRFLLTLSFDGQAFHGWQVQKNAVTVQQTLQDAIEALTGVRSAVIGCSRTDAGVHAEMFCCTFDSECEIPTERIPQALNFYLPASVAVIDCQTVALDFHPRYCAKGKRYEYRIWNGKVRNPLLSGKVMHVRAPLDEAKMNNIAQLFVGEHNFAAFCAADSDVADTVRCVSSASVLRSGDMVVFTVEANGFLYNMVRIMVGTLLDIYFGKLPFSTVEKAFLSGSRGDAGYTVPPEGLYLSKVFYDK